MEAFRSVLGTPSKRAMTEVGTKGTVDRTDGQTPESIYSEIEIIRLLKARMLRMCSKHRGILLFYYYHEGLDRQTIYEFVNAWKPRKEETFRNKEALHDLLVQWIATYRGQKISGNTEAQDKLAYILYTTHSLEEYENWRLQSAEAMERHRSRLRQILVRARKMTIV